VSRSLLILNALAVVPDGSRLTARRSDCSSTAGGSRACAAAGELAAAQVDERIDASGLLLAPGLVNGHLHSWDVFIKGCIENLPMELAMAYLRPRRPVALTERRCTCGRWSARSRRCALARRRSSTT
jgi:cytosine/adenosine deaminase-related metal-dependent hydrolase